MLRLTDELLFGMEGPRGNGGESLMTVVIVRKSLMSEVEGPVSEWKDLFIRN